MSLPPPIARAAKAVWSFPAKGAALLVLGVILWEGDVSRSEFLPVGFALLLAAAFALLFFDKGFPIKICVALVILNLVARDHYPLSHFPMYDRFTDHTFYVYVTDKDGQAVPLQEITGIRTSRLKKPYDKALDKTRKPLKKRKRELTVADRRDAGLTALANLYRDSNPAAKAKLQALAPISLHHVDVFMRDGDLDERPPEKIASLDLPPR